MIYVNDDYKIECHLICGKERIPFPADKCKGCDLETTCLGYVCRCNDAATCEVGKNGYFNDPVPERIYND